MRVYVCVPVEMNENSKQTQRRYFERQQFVEIFSTFLLCWLCCFTIVFRLAPRTIVLNVCARALLYVCEFTRVCVCVCMCASVYLN